MVVRALVKPRMYRDSVKLMSLSAEMRTLPGIEQAVAIMGTERNKAVLEGGGLLVEEARAADPNDLVLVVRGESEAAVREALKRLEEILAEDHGRAEGQARAYSARSLGGALRQNPGANLAIISVPGQYAAAEAAKALRSGMHVLIFSDNVSLEEEIRLKRLGKERGLLVMGPDCGTAIIGGVPLAFANVVARGPIGIVGASGTGIQQASSLISRLDSGLTHAIGTGGRDLNDDVGGVTMLMGLEALAEDPDTKVILVISKPPGPRTAEMVLSRIKACAKPVVVFFVNGDPSLVARAGAVGAATLEEAAVKAVAIARGQAPSMVLEAFPRGDIGRLAADEAAAKSSGQRYVRGLYTGGTLAEEAVYLLEKTLGPVHANVPLRPEMKLADARRSVGHSVIDLGDDEFTLGRPHPMIDPSFRAERLVLEACDPEVAVILCDVVIGFGSHPDPAGVLAGAVREARSAAGRHLTVIASVCGTSSDPQNLERQEATLRREGILVFPSNAYAAEVAGAIAQRCAGRGAL